MQDAKHIPQEKNSTLRPWVEPHLQCETQLRGTETHNAKTTFEREASPFVGPAS